MDNLNKKVEDTTEAKSKYNDNHNTMNEVEIKVPIFSIVPHSNLCIEKAKLDFTAEIKIEEQDENKKIINARICSPEQREADFLPRVSYEIEVKSVPAEEGLLRIVDELCSEQITEMTPTYYSSDGKAMSQENTNILNEISKYKEKIVQMKHLHQVITDVQNDQEKIRSKHTTLGTDIGMQSAEKYRLIQTQMAEKIMTYQEQLIQMEMQMYLTEDEEIQGDNEE